MKAQALTPVVTITEGKLITTSIDISRTFGRRHDHVLDAIHDLDIPEDFRLLNFQEVSYRDSIDRPQPMYRITRDGFTVLVMGFISKKAMQFKLAYIKAFNLMEEKLRAQANLAFLPAPPAPAELLEKSRQDGFVRGLRFMLSVHDLRQKFDMDEQTLQTLLWYRSLGLTQDEAARLCIISRHECQSVEEVLRLHGVKTPVINMSIRKKQIFDRWADLVTQAGLSNLPAPHAISSPSLNPSREGREASSSSQGREVAVSSPSLDGRGQGRVTEVQP